jgi:branched-chain amino acid transport system permease protein/neutral amino acid transport system permease protein
MSAFAARVTDALALANQRLRVQTDRSTAAALWMLIAALFIWAAFAETQLFVVGIVVGSVLALGAIGLTLIYGVLRFGNFAHGDTMMLGAYLTFLVLTGTVVGKRANIDTDVGWSLDRLPGATERLGDLTFGWGFLAAFAVAAVAVAALSIGLDRLIYRPLRRRKSGIVLFAVASLGVAFSTRAVLLMIWGPDPRVYVPGIHRAKHYPFDVVLKTDQIFIFGVALGAATLVYLLLFHTKLGKAMRAYADNAELALVSGINTDRVILWTWMIAGTLMAAAGALLALQANLKPELGFGLLLPIFAAAILGGIGKPQGAFIGAMVVAVTQEVSTEFFSAGYKPGVAFVILVLILLVRPRGLFGSTS